MNRPRLPLTCAALATILTLLPLPADAQATGPGMNYGPFLQYSVSHDPGPRDTKKPPVRMGIADAGLTIDVGNNSAVCFDEDDCRMAAGWTGGFLDLSRTHQTSLKGWWDACPKGTIQFSSKTGPGWAVNGSFADPRPHGFGPLPKDWVHYKGLYRHGRQVVLSYTVGDADVLETPGSFPTTGGVVFTRTIHINHSAVPTDLEICDAGAAPPSPVTGGWVVQGPAGPRRVSARLLPAGAALHVREGRIIVSLPALANASAFVITISPASAEISAKVNPLPPPQDLAALCQGGAALWADPIVTQGNVAPAGSKAYVVDTLTLPDHNPWHSWIRLSGVDFFPDGRCAVCTLNGDVWIVSGIDQNLAHLSWKRFASGLYEPLGLKIVAGKVYVLGRDQITRLTDLNGDGEADFYENFNNDVPAWPAYNAFHMGLQADSHGNFYFLTSGLGSPSWVPMRASAIKVAHDGSKAEVIATGLRAANGGGMLPNDQFVCGDNQGNWIPTSKINFVKPGAFYGFNIVSPQATPQDIATQKKTYDPPLCWIPYEYDTSSGGQVFVTGNRWGPLQGKMLSTSYGKSKLFEVLWEDCDGVMQGATVPLPLNFGSGIMRANFDPADGQLYVAGLKGWQTNGAQDGCLQRVRYTGKQVGLPRDLHVLKDAIAITFTCPLDPKTANDEQSFGVEQYNYRWFSKYDSPKYKISNPSQIGTDDVDVRSAKLSPDGKTVVLSIPNLRPVMQMAIQIHLNAADGTPIDCEIDPTINHVPGSSLPPVLSAP